MLTVDRSLLALFAVLDLCFPAEVARVFLTLFPSRCVAPLLFFFASESLLFSSTALIILE